MASKLGRWMISSAADIPTAEELRKTAKAAQATAEKEEMRSILRDVYREMREAASHGQMRVSFVRDSLSGFDTPIDRICELVKDTLIRQGFEVDTPCCSGCYLRISWKKEQS